MSAPRPTPTMRVHYVRLVPANRPERDGVMTVETFTSAADHAPPFPVQHLSRAAFSRIERVLVAHDTETCDIDGCGQRIGPHLVSRGEYEDEVNNPFYVTDDGQALCEEHGEEHDEGLR
ncbi:hypothetical protein GCM10027273_12010 [Nocardioides pakistanensis]